MEKLKGEIIENTENYEKNIIRLINERLKQNSRALRSKSIGQSQYDWTKNELEELKKKNKGGKNGRNKDNN